MLAVSESRHCGVKKTPEGPSRTWEGAERIYPCKSTAR
jgi:hypothetical protein